MTSLFKTNIHKLFQCALCFLLCLTLCCGVFVFAGEEKAAAYAYTDGYTTVGEVTMPFPEYMPGTYFSKNGGPCTCHDNDSINCVASGSKCNCLRFVEIDGKEIDLLSVQCIGFARYCFYKLFGFIDHDYNTSKYDNVGTLSEGKVTASSVKNLVQKLKPGAHIRFQLSKSQHSVILLNTSETGLTVYHANAGGNGITSSPCVVSTRTFTWESFAAWTYRGILFAHMPKEYPEDLSFSDVPVVEDMSLGTYITTSNLNLRAGAGTDTEAIAVVPIGTTLAVTETKGIWGKVIYEDNEGWISLQYAEFVPVSGTAALVPIENSGITVSDSYIYGVPAGSAIDGLYPLFINSEDISFESDAEGLAATGTVLWLTVNEETRYSYIFVINGDLNRDGLNTAADCFVLKGHLTGTELLAGASLYAADVDGDGMISTADYKKLQLMLK